MSMKEAVNGMHLPELGNVQVASVAVQLLEQILAAAKAGQVTTVGIIMIDPNGGVATPWAGPQIPPLYTGAGMMQARIIRSIDAPPKSSIIPARQVG